MRLSCSRPRVGFHELGGFELLPGFDRAYLFQEQIRLLRRDGVAACRLDEDVLLLHLDDLERLGYAVFGCFYGAPCSPVSRSSPRDSQRLRAPDFATRASEGEGGNSQKDA